MTRSVLAKIHVLQIWLKRMGLQNGRMSTVLCSGYHMTGWVDDSVRGSFGRAKLGLLLGVFTVIGKKPFSLCYAVVKVDTALYLL